MDTKKSDMLQLWTQKCAGIEELRLHNLGNKFLTCLIPTLLHHATMGIEVCMNWEERGCEIVERRYAD
jgi:hypothetical protein